VAKRRPNEVERAVRRDLRKLEPEIRQSGLAASALAMAQLLDGVFETVCRECRENVTVPVEASARDAAGVARELRATLEHLETRGDSDAGEGFVAGLLAPVVDATERAANPRRRAGQVRRGVGDAPDAVAATRRGRGAGTGP
jgi:hypothetical protein